MTTVPRVLSGGVYVPEYVPQRSKAVDFDGTSFCFVTDDDLLNPDARVLANPSKLVKLLNAAPVVVPATMFGLHILSPSVSTVNVSAGFLRSHDASIRWDQIATADGVYTWTAMDAWVTNAEAIGAKPLYTIFGTPNWCASMPAQTSHYPGKPGIASPPTSITKLTDFLTALLARYGSRIKHFEVWNEVNIEFTVGVAAYWSGTNAQLIDMCVAVYDTVKAAIPSATIISPSTQGWGQGLEEIAVNVARDPNTYLAALLAATNTAGTRTLASACDLIGMHSYYPGGVTRQWQGMAAAIRAVLTTAGVSKGIFDTETGLIDLEDNATLYTDDKYLRLLKQNMVCAAALGFQGQCWYAYDHSGMGFNSRAGLITAYTQLATYLHGATINSALQYKNGSVVASVTKGGVTATLSV